MTKMIIIKSMETVVVDRDPCPFIHKAMPGECVRLNNDGDYMVASEVVEYVQGRRYRRSDGTDLLIGMKQEVQDLLGIQFEMWDRLRNSLTDAESTVFELACERNKIQSARWWTRLKWLFCGVPVEVKE
jgi:hypothetical protein